MEQGHNFLPLNGIRRRTVHYLKQCFKEKNIRTVHGSHAMFGWKSWSTFPEWTKVLMSNSSWKRNYSLRNRLFLNSDIMMEVSWLSMQAKDGNKTSLRQVVFSGSGGGVTKTMCGDSETSSRGTSPGLQAPLQNCDWDLGEYTAGGGRNVCKEDQPVQLFASCFVTTHWIPRSPDINHHTPQAFPVRMEKDVTEP